MKSYQITWRTVFIFLSLLKCCHGFFIKNYINKNYSHLNYSYVKKLCNNRDEICRSNDTVVCTVRLENDTIVYRNFENSCYLFMSNMCNHPDNEFCIIEGDTCKNYLNSRRSIQRKNANDTRNATDYQFDFNSTSTDNDTSLLRARSTTPFKQLYNVPVAYDDHICPLTCPEIYSPVCLFANRNYGQYYKYYTFVNHCHADVFYCKNHNEFAPPPELSTEDADSSMLGWSHCGAIRYLQFTRFTETISSMGHYGWLAGNYRYSHIMEPHERKPGYG